MRKMVHGKDATITAKSVADSDEAYFDFASPECMIQHQPRFRLSPTVCAYYCQSSEALARLQRGCLSF